MLIKNILRVLLTAAGVLLLLDTAVMTVLSNFSFGIILTVLLGAVLAAWGIWFDKINEKTCRGVLRAIKYVAAAGIVFTVGMCCFIAVYGNTDTADGTENIIMVLGCSVKGTEPTQPLKERLDKAITAYGNTKNPNTYIVVSGGQGAQEDISEADAMEKYLAERGIDSSVIIKEDKSTSTSENYKFSKAILDERFGDYKMSVITNDFHIYRSKQLAKLAGLDVTTLHAKTPLSSAPMAYLREVAAIFKMWIFKY